MEQTEQKGVTLFPHRCDEACVLRADMPLQNGPDVSYGVPVASDVELRRDSDCRFDFSGLPGLRIDFGQTGHIPGAVPVGEIEVGGVAGSQGEALELRDGSPVQSLVLMVVILQTPDGQIRSDEPGTESLLNRLVDLAHLGTHQLKLFPLFRGNKMRRDGRRCHGDELGGDVLECLFNGGRCVVRAGIALGVGRVIQVTHDRVPCLVGMNDVGVGLRILLSVGGEPLGCANPTFSGEPRIYCIVYTRTFLIVSPASQARSALCRVLPVGLEPTTYGFRGRCSTVELSSVSVAHGHYSTSSP